MFDKSKMRADICLIAGLIVICIIAYLIIQFVIKKDGDIVLVKVDGEIKYELSLSKNQTIEIAGYEGGINSLQIEDGFAYMKEADCPDDICVLTGKISKTGETIVCLPHRVVVEIVGSEHKEYDAVVK